MSRRREHGHKRVRAPSAGRALQAERVERSGDRCPKKRPDHALRAPVDLLAARADRPRELAARDGAGYLHPALVEVGVGFVGARRALKAPVPRVLELDEASDHAPRRAQLEARPLEHLSHIRRGIGGGIEVGVDPAFSAQEDLRPRRPHQPRGLWVPSPGHRRTGGLGSDNVRL